MKKMASVAASLIVIATAAAAQAPPDTPKQTPPAPVERQPTPTVQAPPMKAEPDALILSEAQAKALIDKTVYSSDDKSAGGVGAFVRDPKGKVLEMHADIGGFLGIGTTRIRVMPDQFTISGERVVLKMTYDEAKKLPQVR